jgi:hypothetical protein
MGNITIGIMFETKWKEKKLGDTGFQGIIDQLKYHKSINFISESYSPSGRVVKVKGEEYKLVLKNWINKNLNLS